LITGGRGQLASGLAEQFESDNRYEVVCLDRSKLDVENENQTSDIIKKENPQIIIHTAAETNTLRNEKRGSSVPSFSLG